MRLPDEPGSPVLPPAQPTRDLLLAQALDACIAAERRLPGSSQEIIARQPAWARGDLQRLVGLAGSLDAATSNAIMSSEFRVAARARLMQRIGGEVTPPQTGGIVGGHPAPAARTTSRPPGVAPLSMVSSSQSSPRGTRRAPVWIWRATASLVAAVLAGAATLTASASALPGEPLYSLKEAREELAVRLAGDDEHRALALLQQANARLDETTRLLQQGRTLDATVTAVRYDQTVQRATTSYVGTFNDLPANAPTMANALNIEASLSRDHDQLQVLLQSAPEPARADLREALVATERGRARVAELRPVERPVGRADREAPASAVAAVVPTLAVEDVKETIVEPTAVPTVAIANPTAIPTQRPAVVPPTRAPAAVVAAERDDDSGDADTPPVVAQDDGSSGRGSAGEGGRDGPRQARPVTSGDRGHGSTQRAEVAPVVSPTLVAEAEPEATSEESFEVNGHGGGGGDDDHRQMDRADVAAPINGRTAASPIGGQADRGGHREDLQQTVVAHQSQEPTSVRSVPAAQVVTSGPERGITPNTSATTSPSTASNSNTGDRNGSDGGGEVRVWPTAQVITTKPPGTSASTPPPPQASRHGGDGDSTRGDGGDQKSSTAIAPASHTSGGDHSSTDGH